jgi:hypothetical protein
MTAPPMPICAICGFDLDGFTVDIGDDQVHDNCAQDEEHVAKCAHCGQLAIREDAEGWAVDADGDLCPVCAAASVAEHGSAEAVPSPPAGAVRSMAAILRQVSA